MKHIPFLALTALLLTPLAGLSATDGLVVYPPVPGLAASEHYKVRVRSASDGSTWQSAFACYVRSDAPSCVCICT